MAFWPFSFSSSQRSDVFRNEYRIFPRKNRHMYPKPSHVSETVTCIRNRHMYPKPSHVSETVTRLGAGHTFGCGSHVWAYRAGGTPPAPPAQPAPPDASENTSILLPGLPQLRVLAPAGHEFVVGTELREVAINHDGHAVSIMRGVKPMRDGDDRASL